MVAVTLVDALLLAHTSMRYEAETSPAIAPVIRLESSAASLGIGGAF